MSPEVNHELGYRKWCLQENMVAVTYTVRIRPQPIGVDSSIDRGSTSSHLKIVVRLPRIFCTFSAAFFRHLTFHSSVLSRKTAEGKAKMPIYVLTAFCVIYQSEYLSWTMSDGNWKKKVHFNLIHQRYQSVYGLAVADTIAAFSAGTFIKWKVTYKTMQ